MDRRRAQREGSAIALALLVHAAGGLGLARLGSRVVAPAAVAASSTSLELELDVDGAGRPAGTATAPARTDVAAPDRSSSRAAAPLRPPASERAARVAPAPGPGPASMPGEPQASAVQDTAGVGADHEAGAPARSPEGLGVGRGGAWLLARPEVDAGVARPTAQQRGRALERSLAQGAAERDVARGLAREGAVLSALERAAAHADVPPEGRARFGVEVDGRGRVVGVEVLDANGDLGAWTRAARAARAALAGKRLTVTRALSLEVEVLSRVVLPSGHTPGTEVSVAGIPLDKPQRHRKRTRVRILEPKVALEEVEVDVPGRGKVTMLAPNIGILPFATDADPADLGATPRRLVQARVVKRTVQ